MRLASLVALTCVVVPSVAAAAEPLSELCRSILKSALEKPEPEEPEGRIRRLAFIGDWPRSLVEGEFVEALGDDEPAVRLAASERLARIGDEHRLAIRTALDGLRFPSESDAVRADRVLAALGDAGARKRLRTVAVSERLPVRKLGSFVCAMHPRIRTKRDGRCPICGMELVEYSGRDLDGLAARLLAIESLLEFEGERVGELCASILADDVAPTWRLTAAEIWARAEPERGLPHFRVFMNGPRRVRSQALVLATEYHARFVVVDFERALRSDDPLDRLQASVGLVAAGRRTHLDAIRQVVRVADRQGDLLPRAIAALAYHGAKRDMELLAPHLRTTLRERAAAAILRIEERVTDDVLE